MPDSTYYSTFISLYIILLQFVIDQSGIHDAVHGKHNNII